MFNGSLVALSFLFSNSDPGLLYRRQKGKENGVQLIRNFLHFTIHESSARQCRVIRKNVNQMKSELEPNSDKICNRCNNYTYFLSDKKGNLFYLSRC